MTPDQKFARWIKYAMMMFILIFGYFLLADSTIPLTPQAMATRVVTKVAPQVSGQIVKVYIHNNEAVHQGDILFQIDPKPYELAVQQSQLNLDQAIQNNQQLDASIAAAQAEVTASSVISDQKTREYYRLNTLLSHNGTSKQQRDDAWSNATAAKANLLAAKARLKEMEVERGALNSHNVNVQLAKNQLDKALLNLSYTHVKAKHDGMITNLQLEQGTYAAVGNPLVALVSTKVDIIADFREKSLRNYTTNSKALVAFDSLPGQVFPAHITSLDAGVSSGQFDPNGQLASPIQSSRWIRDAQRIRQHLQLDEALPKSLPSGAQATVQLLPDNNPLFSWLAHTQIRFLSLLHYIY